MRPRIKLLPSPFDKTLEAIALCGLILLWSLSVLAFLKLPSIIPIHFGLSGKPDNYGSKYTLFLLPAIGTGVYLLLTTLNKHPHIFNYGVNITEANAATQYTYATRMLRVLKAIIMVLLCMIIAFAYLNIQGRMKGLGAWFFPFFICSMLAPTAYYIIKSMRKN